MADLSPSEPFDIVSKYRSLLSSDPDLSPPVAAIESLITLLASSPATTISETLTLLSHSSATLRSSEPNWIALSAGTDLFQRYLVQSLNRPGAREASGGDFGHLRQHLLSNGRLFVSRAKKAAARIAQDGRHFIREGCTVLTNGNSRVVRALLLRAAIADAEQRLGEDKDGYPFRVIYVSSSPSNHSSVPTLNSNATDAASTEDKNSSLPAALRFHGIPTATIPYSALATAIPQCDLVLVGAEAVVESGGIISHLGTQQIALLAQSIGSKPVYVAAESFRFVRLFPLSSGDLPVRQEIVRFVPDDDSSNSNKTGVSVNSDGDDEGVSADGLDENKSARDQDCDQAIDFTPPNLISALITENGVLTPSAISEELVKLLLYFN